MKVNKILMVLIGNLVMAFGAAAFIAPSGMLSGGTTGIALFVHKIFHVPVSATAAAVNISMMCMGLLILGRDFFMKTVLSSCVYPVFLFAVTVWIPEGGIVTDLFLNAVFGGVLMGIGVGCIFFAGGSSGGMDIPALAASKKTGIPVSVYLYGFDLCILMIQAVYSNMTQILYSVVMVFLTSYVIHYMVNRRPQQIVNLKKEANEMILNNIHKN